LPYPGLREDGVHLLESYLLYEFCQSKKTQCAVLIFQDKE